MITKAFASTQQHTVAQDIPCNGIGLHSGEQVVMTIKPAHEDAGITFVRTDIDGGTSERAQLNPTFDAVTDTMLGTKIENTHGTKLSTIEHLMAALWGMGVDNATIELDAPEVPIVDGSSAPYITLIEAAGLVEQAVARKTLVIDAPITVRDGESEATIYPYDGFVLDVEIEFDHQAIPHQRAVYDFELTSFKDMLSQARTFGFAHEVEQLQSMGLARGGSLDNAIVVGEEGVLNEDGLRFDDEFIRHKALDCVGDYFLAGMKIKGRVVTKRPGHGINNKLLHAVFADNSAYHIEGDDDAELPSFTTMPVSTGAAASLPARVLMSADKK